MDEWMLHPEFLSTDWRDDARPLLIVDLGRWPKDLPIDPLPPVPILAVGTATHTQVAGVDVLIDDHFTLATMVRRICAKPMAAASVTRLLRAIEGLPAARALPLESFAYAMLQAGEEHAAWLRQRSPSPALPPGTLHVDCNGATLDLNIDRPVARNAFDRDMRDALYDAFNLVALDSDIRQVRLRATGRCFSMGADLSEFGTTRDPVTAHAIRSRTLPAYPMIRRAEIYHVHVRGGCVGSGIELAAFAGTLTASADAWFQLPETAMGILPGFGGCVSIPRRIGRQRATGLLLSGKRIGAQTALDWGLIDRIVDDPSVDDRGADLRIA